MSLCNFFELTFNVDYYKLNLYRYCFKLCPAEFYVFFSFDGLHFGELQHFGFFLLLTCFLSHCAWRFTHFCALIGMDYLSSTLIVFPLQGYKYRFGITYILNSLFFRLKLKIYVYLKNRFYPVFVSICSYFNGANWAEREVFDLFGVFFKRHSDLRRLLSEYGMKGYPLRKNYPLTGFFEIHFANVQKKIVHELLTLMQEIKINS